MFRTDRAPPDGLTQLGRDLYDLRARLFAIRESHAAEIHSTHECITTERKGKFDIYFHALSGDMSGIEEALNDAISTYDGANFVGQEHDYSDPFAEHRLTGSQLGLGRTS